MLRAKSFLFIFISFGASLVVVMTLDVMFLFL